MDFDVREERDRGIAGMHSFFNRGFARVFDLFKPKAV